jgi:hypothetical protein
MRLLRFYANLGSHTASVDQSSKQVAAVTQSFDSWDNLLGGY